MAGRSEKTGGRTTIWLPPHVLEELDRIAGLRFAKRSALIREAVMAWLRGLRQDERGAA